MKRLIIALLICVLYFYGNAQFPKQISFKGSTSSVARLENKNDSSAYINNGSFSVNFHNDNTYSYQSEGKHISIKPVGYKWESSSSVVITNNNVGKIDNNRYVVNDLYGNGISIINKVSQDTWEKLITINSLENLGAIPSNSKYLEFIFEIETDFNIKHSNAVWDKKTDLPFIDNLVLSENCMINGIKSWDSKGVKIDCYGMIYSLNNKTYIMKRIPISFLKSSTFPLTTDLSITYGSEYVASVSSSSYVVTAALTSTKFVVAYNSVSAGRLKIGNISGSIITYSSETIFYSGTISRINIVAISSTRVLLSFYNATTKVNAMIVDIASGDIVTLGSPVVASTSTITQLSMSLLTNNRFVLAYTLSSSTYAIIGVISGTSISYPSAATTFNSTYAYANLNAMALDSLNLVVTYQDPISPNKAKGATFPISGNVISSFGYSSTIGANSSTSITSVKISSTKFLLLVGSTGYCYIGTIAFHSLTFDATGYLSSTGTVPNISMLSNNSFVISYSGTSSASSMLGLIAEDFSITYSIAYSFNTSNVTYLKNSRLSESTFVVGYTDVGNSNYATCRIGTAFGVTQGKKINGVLYSKWNNSIITKYNNF